jgi:hypothetical protein
MRCAFYAYWFEAVETAHRTHQTGEFSEAELAARQTPVPRGSVTERLSATLLAVFHQPTVLPKATAPV